VAIIAHRITYPGLLIQIDEHYTVGIRGTSSYLLDPEANFFNQDSDMSFAKIIKNTLVCRDYIKR